MGFRETAVPMAVRSHPTLTAKNILSIFARWNSHTDPSSCPTCTGNLPAAAVVSRNRGVQQCRGGLPQVMLGCWRDRHSGSRS